MEKREKRVAEIVGFIIALAVLGAVIVFLRQPPPTPIVEEWQTRLDSFPVVSYLQGTIAVIETNTLVLHVPTVMDVRIPGKAAIFQRIATTDQTTRIYERLAKNQQTYQSELAAHQASATDAPTPLPYTDQSINRADLKPGDIVLIFSRGFTDIKYEQTILAGSIIRIGTWETLNQ